MVHDAISRRDFGFGAAAALLLAGCATPRAGAARGADDVLLFAYFMTGRGEADGLRLAVSEDGYAFRPLAGGRSLLKPEVGEKKLLRDPFIFRGEGPDAPWHMLWTTAWEGVTIGHATTRDFVTWTPQRALPVMASVPGTRNCWAPEAIFDAATGKHLIFWSSTVTGRFEETAGSSESAYNHRLWAVRTADFETFEAPFVLYDPKFSVIDGTFARDAAGGLHLIVKDETVEPPRKTLHVASAQSVTGPFGPVSPAFSPAWVEGPMTATVDGRTLCYYDVYKEGRWGAAATRDFTAWEDVSARLSMPAGARHGSLVWAPRALLAGLEG